MPGGGETRRVPGEGPPRGRRGVDGGWGGVTPEGFPEGGEPATPNRPQVRVVGGFNGWVPGVVGGVGFVFVGPWVGGF